MARCTRPAILSGGVMQPLTIITGFVLGTAGAIFLGLTVVVILFYFIGLDSDWVRDEVPALRIGVALFGVLTALSVASFVGVLRRTPWRWWAQAAMWLGVLVIARYFWPSG